MYTHIHGERKIHTRQENTGTYTQGGRYKHTCTHKREKKEIYTHMERMIRTYNHINSTWY